ncbi:MAG TPA: hypothetical protein DDX92_02215 [Flavobacteriales bacterium]|jgi:hypothetical protein|nr:hypothetical protein [Flavobacteriales bacterium]
MRILFVLSTLLILFGTSIKGQSTQATFFSENGEKFYLYVNNKLINRAPFQQVTAFDLSQKKYLIKIVFQDLSFKSLTEDIKPKKGRQTVYIVSGSSSGSSLDVYSKGKKGTYDESYAPPTIYDDPSYTGRLGCPYPMNEEKFHEAVDVIRKDEIQNSKMSLAKKVISDNCLSTKQLRVLLSALDYESDRLDLAKFAWPQTYDQENFYMLNDVFTYPNTIEEIDRFINQNQ